jgi:anthranilate phosphoribosyltransferase
MSGNEAVARFAGYVAAIGRGPGRARALTFEEAADAMALMLAGVAEPVQIGAFLMLLRYRGEGTGELAGMVSAARAAIGWPALDVALDWPSYGAGRSRGAPWFLLAAMALGRAGHRVFMHGTNEFSGGMSVAEALARLGVEAVHWPDEARRALAETGFAYVALETLSPAYARLLDLRRLLGLRSPLNTVARLLNPADAPAGVDGVFHPPYIEAHLAAAERLGRQRLLVLKGGGGEAERNPAKPVSVHVWDAVGGRSDSVLPALSAASAPEEEPDIAAVWQGVARDAAIEARIVGTIALGLVAIVAGGDAEARTVWEARHGKA